MTVVVQHKKNGWLLLAQGCIDAADSFILEQVARFTELSRSKGMWVDCGGTSMTSEALSRIRSLPGKAGSSGVNLVFYRMSSALEDVLR